MHTTLVRASLGALALSSLAFFTACNVEDSANPEVDSTEAIGDDEPLGSVEQAVFTGYVGSGVIIAHPGDPNRNIQLGNDTGVAGFLTAVAGNMNGGSAYILTDLGANNDKMHLLVYAGTNGTFRADGALVYPGAMTNGVAFSTTSGVREERLGSAANPLRRCYIKSICGGANQFFDSADDGIAIVKKSDNYWYLRMTGDACGSAACMLISEPGPWVANGPGTYSLGGTDQGKACWLTGVAGRFRENDAYKGVYLRPFYPNGPNNPGTWQLVVSNDKWGGAECAK